MKFATNTWKNMENKDFAVFILTHGRPDNVKTVNTLKKCGYTGKTYFIVDNEDKTIEKYRKNFGSEWVKVFDKKAMADQVDEGNNFDERRTITHARNACFEIAKEIGITYFVQLDDDYTSFRYRWIDKYITSGTVKKLDIYFDIILNFYKNTNFLSIAFAQGGDFIGGEGCGMISNYKYNSRKCMNSFFCSIEREFQFVGAMNEDVNTYATLGSRGNLFLTLPFIGLEQTPTQSNKSGITDMYLKYGTYCKGFTTVMMHPSSVNVAMMGFTQNRLHHRIKWINTTPMIINEKHRKL
jgi:hypothetical protein